VISDESRAGNCDIDGREAYPRETIKFLKSLMMHLTLVNAPAINVDVNSADSCVIMLPRVPVSKTDEGQLRVLSQHDRDAAGAVARVPGNLLAASRSGI